MGLEDFSKEEISLVLETAKEMKNIIHRDIKKVPALRGSHCNAFLRTEYAHTYLVRTCG